MDHVTANTHAEDVFDGVLARVGADQWEQPSRCPGWSIADVAGHVVWGRRLLAACAEGEELDDRSGGPGAEHPADGLAGDPLTAWRTARATLDALLTPENLERPAPAFVLAQRPDDKLGDFLDNLTGDLVCHAWDIAAALGLDVEVDPGVLEVASAAAHRGLNRGPGFFAPEREAPQDATPLEAVLAYHGRDPRA